MLNFEEYTKQEDFVHVIKEAYKPWTASNTEIMALWQRIRPGVPISMKPVAGKNARLNRKRRRFYGEDGIRITGRWEFIVSVMSRLKEILGQENQMAKLRLTLRSVDPGKTPNPGQQSFSLYVNLELKNQE